MEPVFCKDFLIAKFEDVAEKKGTRSVFVPTPGKVPRVPQINRGVIGGRGLMMRGLRVLLK